MKLSTSCSRVFAIAAMFGSTAVLAQNNPPPEPRGSSLPDQATAAGTFSYSFPIPVPRLRGPTPELSLTYDSGRGNGIAGVGWSLSGLPAIVLAPGDDGRFNTSNRDYVFLPEGWDSTPSPDMRLVGVQKSVGTRFHLAKNISGGDFLEFEPSGSCGQTPCHWIMRDGNGTKYYFGGDPSNQNNAAALMEPSNGVQSGRGVILWGLFKVVDPDGNYFQVTYVNNGRTLYPGIIEYNLPSRNSESTSGRIWFEYELRSDLTPMPQLFPSRLRNIRIYGGCILASNSGCSLISRHQFNYQSGSTGRSLLAQILEYGKDGDIAGVFPLPATTFQYTIGGPEARFLNPTGQFLSGYSDCTWNTHLGDIDGDGRADLVRAQSGNCGFIVQYTCGTANGFDGPIQTYFNDSNQQLGVSGLADLDGDGRQDLIVAREWGNAWVARGATSCGFEPWVLSPQPPLAEVPRLLTADINGDGLADVVFYRESTRSLSFRLATGNPSDPLAPQVSSAPWSTCNPSFPPEYTFTGISAFDVDQDGRQDIVAGWAGAPATSGAGKLTVMTAKGTATGLGIPTEYCENIGAGPDVRWPYFVLRPADINGDGRIEPTFSYLGKTHAPEGVTKGLDLRYRLSSTSPGGFGAMWSSSSQAYANLSENKRNNWSIELADVTGDGIDDWIAAYRGTMGDYLKQMSGSPLGPLPVVNRVNNANNTWNEGPFANGNQYRRWFATTGDLNGDGAAELIWIQAGDLIDTEVVIAAGGPAGIGLPQSPISRPLRFNGDAGAFSVRSADISGDGRADFVVYNDDASEPSGRWVAYAASQPGPEGSGLPDLLSVVRSPLGGTIRATYVPITTLGPAAITRDNTCGGATGTISGAVCGRSSPAPRAVVRTIHKDDGRGFTRSVQFDYTNARVRLGRWSQRTDLGFETVKVTDLQTGAAKKTYYRQDVPYNGLTRRVEILDSAARVVTANSYEYSSSLAFNGVTALKTSLHRVTMHEQGVLVRQRDVTFTWSTPDLKLLERRDEIIFPTVGEAVVQKTFFMPNDDQQWIIRRELGTTIYRGQSYKVLGMRRFQYDPTAIHRLIKIDKLLIHDADISTCQGVSSSSVLPPDSPSTCATEISSGKARWVTIFQNPTYDSSGNISYYEKTWTPAPIGGSFKHHTTLTYEPEYSARPLTITNAKSHVTTYDWDVAGRLLSLTDPNQQADVWTYDRFGRKETHSRAGAGSPTESWEYYEPPVYAARITHKSWSAPNEVSQNDTYLDGFGDAYRSVQYVPEGEVEILTHNVYVNGTIATRRSLPHFTNEPAHWIEISRDSVGRPLAKRLLDENFLHLQDLSTISYGTDSSITTSDALQHPTRVELDGWGNVLRRIDAAGEATTYQYDAGFNFRKITLPTGETGNIVDLVFDSFGRRRSISDAQIGYQKFSYDDVGNLATIQNYATSAGGTPIWQIDWLHDALDRPVFEATATTSMLYYHDEATSPSSIGRLSRVIEPSGTTVFGYDPRGNVASAEHSLTGLSGSFTYSYDYDWQDRLVHKRFPVGKPEEADQWLSYSADGAIRAVSHDGVTYATFNQYDANRMPKNLYTYLPPGEPDLAENYANTTLFSYTVLGRLEQLTVKDQSELAILDDFYHYDLAGNLSAIDDLRDFSVRFVNSLVDTTRSLTTNHDELNRLKWVSNAFGTTHYEYDALGNITDDELAKRTYSNCGSAKCITGMNGAALIWYAEHDPAGRRVSFLDYRVAPAAQYFYGYDHRSRLATVTRGGTVRERYEYDFADNRTKKVFRHEDGTQTTTWFVGDSYQIQESSAGPGLRSITWEVFDFATITGGDLLPKQLDENTVVANVDQPYQGDVQHGNPHGTYLHHGDRLGTSVLLTSTSQGARLGHQWFDSYGSFSGANSIGVAITSKALVGSPREEYSSLQYLQSRYYDPLTKRFITPDNIVPGPDAQAYNRFAFALNSPLNNVDATGHCSGFDLLCIVTSVLSGGTSSAPGGDPTRADGTPVDESHVPMLKDESAPSQGRSETNSSGETKQEPASVDWSLDLSWYYDYGYPTPRVATAVYGEKISLTEGALTVIAAAIVARLLYRLIVPVARNTTLYYWGGEANQTRVLADIGLKGGATINEVLPTMFLRGIGVPWKYISWFYGAYGALSGNPTVWYTAGAPSTSLVNIEFAAYVAFPFYYQMFLLPFR